MKAFGRQNFGNTSWTFLQDGAPAYTVNTTQQWFLDQEIDFISKEQWTPSSPDLNPVDYSVWSIVEQRVCASSHANINSLKACLQREWLKIPQDHFRRTVYQFRPRFQVVVRKKGGYIE